MATISFPPSFNFRNEFNSALLNGHLSLHYQPIVDLENGHVKGFETLMRWNHPEHGPISRSGFIPVAVESGLIIAASKWALKEACRALKRIEGRIGQVKDLYMSVNFTASDFAEDNFLDDLYQIISVSDVLPTQIQLEITEELLLSQPESAKNTLALCRKAGLKIAVDDFGTGSRELGFLEEFPIDSIKLDRSLVRHFIENPDALESFRPALAIAKARHLTVTAEGIEQREEALALKELGCNTAQGYYFAKPLPEKDVTELLLEASGFAEKLKSH